MFIAIVEMTWIAKGKELTDFGLCLGSSRTDIEANIEAKARCLLSDGQITTLTVEASIYKAVTGWAVPVGELGGAARSAA